MIQLLCRDMGSCWVRLLFFRVSPNFPGLHTWSAPTLYTHLCMCVCVCTCVLFCTAPSAACVSLEGKQIKLSPHKYCMAFISGVGGGDDKGSEVLSTGCFCHVATVMCHGLQSLLPLPPAIYGLQKDAYLGVEEQDPLQRELGAIPAGKAESGPPFASLDEAERAVATPAPLSGRAATDSGADLLLQRLYHPTHGL